VYDLLGREVAVLADGIMTPGEHRVVWNPTGIASGTYICRLTSRGVSRAVRMTYLR